tara:strand:+ start:2535 stop:2807 length:273 start_codon:yes stop_codon:yes gene_type:complete
MIQAMVVKLIFSAIMKKINEKHNLKKMDDYVNKDNVLDRQMKQVQKNQTKILKNQEIIEKDIGSLKNDSHPPIKNLEKRIKWLEKQARKK